MSKSPRLTKTATGYDLLLENGTTPFVTEGTQAAQHAGERLLIFVGEISLDGALTTKTKLGTKWYETIFDMSKDVEEKELELKGRILGTPGVERILEWDWSQTGATVTITAKVQTSWGADTIQGAVTLL